jgi:hypothetical protein
VLVGGDILELTHGLLDRLLAKTAVRHVAWNEDAAPPLSARRLHVVERYRLVGYDEAEAAVARNLKQNNRVPDTASDLTYKGTRLQLVFTVEDEGVFTMGRSLMSAQEWHGRKTSAPRTYLNFSRRKIKLSFRREQAGFLKVGSSLWCEPACGLWAAASGLTDLPRTPQIRPVTSALCRKHQARQS